MSVMNRRSRKAPKRSDSLYKKMALKSPHVWRSYDDSSFNEGVNSVADNFLMSGVCSKEESEGYAASYVLRTVSWSTSVAEVSTTLSDAHVVSAWRFTTPVPLRYSSLSDWHCPKLHSPAVTTPDHDKSRI